MPTASQRSAFLLLKCFRLLKIGWNESCAMIIVPRFPYHEYLIYRDVTTPVLTVSQVQNSGFNLDHISAQT